MKTALLILLSFFCVAEAYALKPLVIINPLANEPTGPLRLVSSVPYDRQVLDEPPQVVVFSFSQPIRPDKTIIRVYDAQGSQIETSEIEAQGLTLSVTVNGLTTGKYSIKWRTRCLCDEADELSDTFHFTVR